MFYFYEGVAMYNVVEINSDDLLRDNKRTACEIFLRGEYTCFAYFLVILGADIIFFNLYLALCMKFLVSLYTESILTCLANCNYYKVTMPKIQDLNHNEWHLSAERFLLLDCLFQPN